MKAKVNIMAEPHPYIFFTLHSYQIDHSTLNFSRVRGVISRCSSSILKTDGYIVFSVLRRLEYFGSETCTLISPQEFRLRREPRVILFFCSQVFREQSSETWTVFFFCSHMIYDAEFKNW